MLTITFADDSIDTLTTVFNALHDIVVKISYADKEPELRAILGADDDGIMVCEIDDNGVWIANATWLVPYEDITAIEIQ